MTIWNTRERAYPALEGSLRPEAEVLQEVFDLVDECLDKLAQVDRPFARLCCLLIIKARNLALGCYSLSLDALAQEAGALLRPLIEALQLLTYFRLDPSRVEEALDGRLPKAGRLLLGRVHLPLQSPDLAGPGPPVLPAS